MGLLKRVEVARRPGAFRGVVLHASSGPQDAGTCAQWHGVTTKLRTQNPKPYKALKTLRPKHWLFVSKSKMVEGRSDQKFQCATAAIESIVQYIVVCGSML